MKKFTALFVTCSALALLALSVSTTGCRTAPVPGTTNVVTTIDPAKLAQVQAAIEPVLSSVLRRSIANSPQHAVEIGNYARAIGHIFCQMQDNSNFTPTYLINAANTATAGLQAGVTQEIIDAKNAALAVYTILWNDPLTVQLKTNSWPLAVSQIICASVNQGLVDSGQLGCK